MVDKFGAIEQSRKKHVLELKKEHHRQGEEKVQADTWMKEERLLNRIRTLNDELKLKADLAGGVPQATVDASLHPRLDLLPQSLL